MRPPTHLLVLLGLAVLAFGGSLATSTSLLPLGSINHDEPMYVFEAHMLRQGHVTLPARDAEFFRPWAAGVTDGRVVMKYTPPWPAVIAASQVVFGDGRVALALVAAGLVIVVYLLGVELFDDRRVGLIAAALLSLSPMVVVLSGTFLPYTFQLLVEALFVYLVLSALRRRSAPRLVFAGVALGVALFARPFDALAVGLPFVALTLATGRRDWRAATRRAGLLAAGAAPLLALDLWFNAHTMGSPLRLPFTVTGPYDTFGFGRRGVFASQTFDYGPAEALASLRNLLVLPGWTFGGVIVIGLAAVGLVLSVRSRRRLPAVAAIAAVAGTITVGYFFFWSPYSIVDVWPGAAALGPFYHLPLLLPIALFAAVALDRAVDHLPRPAVVCALLAMVALTAALVPSRLSTNRQVTHDYRAAERVVDRARSDAVVFVSEGRDEGFESTTPFVQNRPDLTGPVLYASDLQGRNLALLDAMPTRAPYRFDYELGIDSQLFQGHPTLTKLELRKGQHVTEHLRLRNPGTGSCAVAFARIGDRMERVVLDSRSSQGRTYDVVWTLVAPGGSPRAGTSPFVVVLPDTGPSGGKLSLGAGFGSSCRARTTDRYERRYPFAAAGRSAPSIELLAPGAGWHEVQFPGRPPAWLRQDLGTILANRR